ncbi:hypothetical protein [Maricaulis parjimensis]|uniref:hypothetical protein n=1 Tax=Maricaulis parjimensis TaxID=144023 RepID=UPI00193983C1|nr:hypothetical protein [Maricaulis parjimensis]
MSDAENTSGPAARKRAAKPEPGSKEERLAEALRANLRRRKAAAKKPASAKTPDAEGNDSAPAQTASEKPAKSS